MASRKDISNQQFGKLIAKNISHKDEKGRWIWNCVCECGEEEQVWISSLTRGKKKQCSKCFKPNLIGKRFGKGVVIDKASHRKESNRQEWILKCDCGNIYQATTASLRGKVGQRTRSCGCYAKSTGNERWNYQGYKEISGTLWNAFIQSAKTRGIDFNLTKEEAYNVFTQQEGKCALTGLDLVFEKDSKNLNSRTASIDRIDSSKPYQKDNIQWLHKHVNLMKNSHSEEYFIEICNLIVKNNRKEVL